MTESGLKSRVIDPEALRRAMTRAKLTQAELARRADLHPSAISHILLGESGGSFRTITRLAQVLGTKVQTITVLRDEAAKGIRMAPRGEGSLSGPKTPSAPSRTTSRRTASGATRPAANASYPPGRGRGLREENVQ